MGQFSKLTEGFDQTKNSWVACAWSQIWEIQALYYGFSSLQYPTKHKNVITPLILTIFTKFLS
jgi:hypothetical protein